MSSCPILCSKILGISFKFPIDIQNLVSFCEDKPSPDRTDYKLISLIERVKRISELFIFQKREY